jgi:uncharacterized protein YjiS (DUF1127 family)
MTITRALTLLARSPASRTLGSWLERGRRRRELRRLPEAVLEDVGITRGDAWREAGKPFWRP